jgi:hypothetical protein
MEEGGKEEVRLVWVMRTENDIEDIQQSIRVFWMGYVLDQKV